MSSRIVCVDDLYTLEEIERSKVVYECFTLPQFNYTYTVENTVQASNGVGLWLYEFPHKNVKGERITFRASRFANLEVDAYEEVDEEVIEQLLYEMFKNDPNGKY